MATRSEFAASIKAKYPQYASVDDSTLVEKMFEKYPTYRESVTDDPPNEETANPGNTKPEVSSARDNVTFLGSETLGKFAADMFPRVAKGAVEGRGMLHQAGAGLNDALSLVGRGIASSGVAPEGAKLSDGNPGLGEIKGSTLSGRILRDPGAGAALAAAPFTGGVSLGGLGGVALRGGLTGLASVGAHQNENLLEGQGFRPGEAAGEMALNVGIPVAGKILAPVAKRAGVKIYNSILKPSERTIKAGFAPSKAEVMKGTEALLETGHTSKGSLADANRSVDDRIDELAAQIEDIITQKSRPQTVTTKAAAFQGLAGKTGVNTTGGVVPEPPPANGLPMGGQKQIGPGSIPMGMPKARANPPGVVVTPNRAPMPNQIDPRFIQPRGGATPNQPPIPDVEGGAAYGIPSDRNLPATLGAAPALQPAQAQPNPADLPVRSVPEIQPQGIGGGQAQLPPGTAENVIDVTNRISLPGALRGANSGIRQELRAGDHAGHALDLQKGAQEWLEDMAASGKIGPVSPKVALQYQRGVGAMGKFDYGQNPQLVPSKARVANKLYGQIGDRLENVAPEIGPLRAEISKLIPQRMALTDAAARTDKNFAVGLREAMAGAAALTGAMSGGAAAALPALGLAGSIRASSSPRVGDAMFRAGKSLAKQSPTRDAIKRWLLETIYAPQENQPQ
jgi:hypothetical protein